MKRTYSIFPLMTSLVVCGMGLAQIPNPGPPQEYPPQDPTQTQKMEQLKAQLDQERKLDLAQYQATLSAHQPEITQMESDHKAQVEAWKDKDLEYHEKMKFLVEDYRDRFQNASQTEKPKLNGELQAKVDALREQLHLDHKQAVDEARKAQLESLKAHQDEVKALSEKMRGDFKALQHEFQEKQKTPVHPDSAK